MNRSRTKLSRPTRKALTQNDVSNVAFCLAAASDSIARADRSAGAQFADLLPGVAELQQHFFCVLAELRRRPAHAHLRRSAEAHRMVDHLHRAPLVWIFQINQVAVG